MSTRTSTSRKSCGTAESASTTSSCESRSTTASWSDARLARGLLELVVEEVVAFLERLHLRRALLAAAAVDVQVGQDPQQPGAQVRPGRVRVPAAERPRVRLLHQVFRLLATADEPSGDAVDLISELKRFLLESHAVACLGGQLAGLGRRHFAHAGHPSKASFQQAPTFPEAALFHRGQAVSVVSARAGCARDVALSRPARACKRLVHRDRLKPVPGASRIRYAAAATGTPSPSNRGGHCERERGHEQQAHLRRETRRSTTIADQRERQSRRPARRSRTRLR